VGQVQAQLDPRETSPARRGGASESTRRSSPPTLHPQARSLLSLQRRAGNRAVSSLVQRQRNDTGLPDELKSGIETLSGVSLDAVRVHYDSAQPAQLNALAYAQGSDIHVGPGQEGHLPHEAWHVVQQAQGRVRPTTQLQDGVSINDDEALEREADAMGDKALTTVAQRRDAASPLEPLPDKSPPVQRRLTATAVRTVTTPYQPATDRLRGEFTLGYTPPVLNGRRVDEQGGQAVARQALGRPTLDVQETRPGTFRARVQAEPVNAVSSDQELMVNPPWTAQGSGHQLVLACEGLGDSSRIDGWPNGTIEVTGQNNNAGQLQAQVQAHEDYHAADNLNAAADVILPWDTALDAMRQNNSAYEGATAAEAQTRLYQAAGGTPDAIADQVTQEWMARSDAYHRTPAGGTTVQDPHIDHATHRVTLPITQP
jgi:hypothetical protein